MEKMMEKKVEEMEEVKITNGILIELDKAMNEVSKTTAHSKFTYALKKNKRTLFFHFRSLRDNFKKNPRQNEFNVEHQKVVAKYALKPGEKDKRTDDQVQADYDKMKKEMEKVNEKFKEVLDIQEENRKIEAKILSEAPEDVVLHKVKSEYFPEMTTEQRERLDVIEDEG
jgi:hypothetical protein